MDKQNRIYYLDLMRITACFLVVMTHSVMSNYAENGKWLGLMSFICSPSSEMFLMLSGAILLPVKIDTSSFYKRRFLKLLPPMAIWSCFGILLRSFQGKYTATEAVEKFVLMPLQPVEGVYWFLYVMIGLYLFAPIISCWLRNATKRSVEFVLWLWLFNMLLPWANLIIPDFYNQSGSYYWVFCNFGGFLGYWILGYYLRSYPPKLFSYKGVCVLVLSVAYCLAILYMKLHNFDTGPYTDNLQIGSVFLIVLLFMALKILSDSQFGCKYINKYASRIAQYSFGIYLLHIYVVCDGVWRLMSHYRIYSHPILETLMITIVSMALCILIMYLFRIIYKPLGKWMFGLK